MRIVLSPEDARKLRVLDLKLKSACLHGRVSEAEETLKSICRIFGEQSADERVLAAKLWYFEALLDTNHPVTAESGFVGISRRANPDTLLYLEAIFLTGVCLLRQKKIAEAKERFREAFRKLGNIQSKKSRVRHEKRMIERVEEETLIAQTIGTYRGELIPELLHKEAVALIQTKSEEEILELMASELPIQAVQLLLDLRGDAILQLPAGDHKYLPSSTQAATPLNLGRRVATFLKRIGWRTLCDSDSPIYQTWSSKLPEIFSVGFFTKALAETFQHWQIQIPAFVAGVAAIAMKYSAQEFCARTKPESIMEVRGKKAD